MTATLFATAPPSQTAVGPKVDDAGNNLTRMSGVLPLISPLSEYLVVREATAEQRKALNELPFLAPETTPHIGPAAALERKEFLAKHAKFWTEDSKLVVFVPLSESDTVDSIYCTAYLQRFEMLVKTPEGEIQRGAAYKCNGVYVPKQVRSAGYGSAFVRRMMQDRDGTMSAPENQDARNRDATDVAAWICQNKRQKLLFLGGAGKHDDGYFFWPKFCQQEQITSLKFDLAKAVKEMAEPEGYSATHCKLLDADGTRELMTYHNTLIEQEYKDKYTGQRSDTTIVRPINPLNVFDFRIMWQQWNADHMNVTLPQHWAVEYGQRGSAEWGYLSLVHRLDTESIKIFTYHVPNPKVAEYLFYGVVHLGVVGQKWDASLLYLWGITERERDTFPGTHLMYNEPSWDVSGFLALSEGGSKGHIQWGGQWQVMSGRSSR